METPKEKANELLEKFGLPVIAVCAVELLLSELPDTLLDEQDRYEFWEKVKIELEDF